MFLFFDIRMIHVRFGNVFFKRLLIGIQNKIDSTIIFVCLQNFFLNFLINIHYFLIIQYYFLIICSFNISTFLQLNILYFYYFHFFWFVNFSIFHFQYHQGYYTFQTNNKFLFVQMFFNIKINWLKNNYVYIFSLFNVYTLLTVF